MTAAGVDAQPAPTPQELAAVVAAVELVWPPPPSAAPGPQITDQGRRAWRFSGRWWTGAGPGIDDPQAKSGWATST